MKNTYPKIQIKIGQLLQYTRTGKLGWEDIDEAEQANLIEGQVVMVEEFDPTDYSVKVKESVADTWMSAYHFEEKLDPIDEAAFNYQNSLNHPNGMESEHFKSGAEWGMDYQRKNDSTLFGRLIQALETTNSSYAVAVPSVNRKANQHDILYNNKVLLARAKSYLTFGKEE